VTIAWCRATKKTAAGLSTDAKFQQGLQLQRFSSKVATADHRDFVSGICRQYMRKYRRQLMSHTGSDSASVKLHTHIIEHADLEYRIS
jgi:hypothetical protein